MLSKQMEEQMKKRSEEMQEKMQDLTNAQMKQNLGAALLNNYGKALLAQASGEGDNQPKEPTATEFAMKLLKAMIPSPELMGNN